MQSPVNKQAGQALVESVVGLTYVVIPLLIILPFMAKIGGVQHKAQQASHYSAWERTVWKERRPSKLPRRSGLYLAQKSEQDTAKQIPWRFYQNDGNKLTSRNSSQWDWNKSVHPILRHQTQQNQSADTLLKSNQQTPANTNVLDRFTRSHSGGRLPGAVGSAVGRAVGLLSFTGFSLERDQFYRTSISSNIQNLYLAPFDNLNLNISSNSALLASGWNAAGPYHVKNRVKRLVLTNYMDVSVIRTAQSLLGIIPFGKELRPSRLKLGYVDPDILPTNRLCTYGTTNCGG
ncbi:hypothetical protein FM038_020740 [Shewanella eurypsychrophilus]|uniref:Uncharacterized protein n=1 Tax=Shewanella eurypsychrophilus TaxID=2593656 RepID=A0ABX6VGW9_9GAMM|nr:MULTISPECIES: hypothetical protein [Shewanella]QFU24335.1 hypothetical protein FS418_22450 [Shewanella sp. YLB-09]QPG59535.1 hypothetical protein FM038_020740 [Shewanella eurypsychrophilus]